MTADQHVFLAVAAALALSFGATARAEDSRSRLPATGQTTCWDTAGKVIACAGTGHDGDVLAGAALSYTDNGDGAITDNATGLMWEKQSFDGSIHDMTVTFSWDNAFAHVAELNKANFAGHKDWRLPNLKELASLVNYEKVSPSVSPAFNNNCTRGATVLTGSCTATDTYWSSSSFASHPGFAWYVIFDPGDVENGDKRTTNHVRAVRGGR